MKMFKRAAALALSATLLLLSACSGGKNADERIAKAKEALTSANSLNASYHTELTYTMGEETAKSLNTMELTLISAPELRVKADIGMEMEGVGEQKMTMYVVQEDGKSVQYLTDGAEWYKSAAKEDVASQYNVWSSMDKYLSLAESFREAGGEELDGRSTVKLTGTISGKNLVKVLEEGGMLANVEAMSQDQQTKIKTDLETIPGMEVTLWIDKEGGWPAQFEADFAKTLADMTAQISKTLGGFTEESAATISGAVVRITCANVGSAADFELPAEAHDAQEVTGES